MEGSPGWTARSPCRRALPEVYITGAFEKDPTVTGNLGTTPLSLTSIPTTRPEHTHIIGAEGSASARCHTPISGAPPASSDQHLE